MPSRQVTVRPLAPISGLSRRNASSTTLAGSATVSSKVYENLRLFHPPKSLAGQRIVILLADAGADAVLVPLIPGQPDVPMMSAIDSVCPRVGSE